MENKGAKINEFFFFKKWREADANSEKERYNIDQV